MEYPSILSGKNQLLLHLLRNQLDPSMPEGYCPSVRDWKFVATLWEGIWIDSLGEPTYSDLLWPSVLPFSLLADLCLLFDCWIYSRRGTYISQLFDPNCTRQD